MTLSLGTAYRSFGGEVEASSTPTICRLPDSRRHQLSAIARDSPKGTTPETERDHSTGRLMERGQCPGCIRYGTRTNLSQSAICHCQQPVKSTLLPRFIASAAARLT